MDSIQGYTCGCCGIYHDELPVSYGFVAPAYYYGCETPEECEQRFDLTEDLCIMDQEHYFIRGCVEIPIIGTDVEFIWGIWVSLSEANYHRVLDHEGPADQLEPMFGWFSSQLPNYPDTLNLKAKVNHRGDGLRPYIELEPTDHPLAIEARNGMTIERVRHIADEHCANGKNHG